MVSPFQNAPAPLSVSRILGRRWLRIPTRLSALLLAALAVSTTAGNAKASEEAPKETIWSLVYMGGQTTPLGLTKEEIFEETRNGRKVYRTSTDLRVRMRRMNETLEIHTESEQVEDAASGQLVALKQKQVLSSQETVHEGVLDGDVLNVSITSYGQTKQLTLPWSSDILGPVAQTRLIAETIASGKKDLEYRTFTFDFMKVTTATHEFFGREPVEIEGKKMSLVRSESETDVLPGIVVTSWHGNDGKIERSVVPLGGKIEHRRVSEATARDFLDDTASAPPELLMSLSAPVDIRIPKPYSTTSAVYELQFPKGFQEGLGFSGGTQRVTVLSEDRVLLRVSRLEPPKTALEIPVTAPDLSDYLESNLRIQSDHPGIRTTARRVVGKERDPWKAAKRLEKWVYRKIRDKNLGVGFATAAEVFDTESGDCTEHSVLLAASCRAVGVPARVAVGLLYFEDAFAGHMWTEINIEGQWFPLDATLAKPFVDASRIRFDSSSLKEEGIADSFMAIGHVLGSLEVKVREYAHGDRVWKEGTSNFFTIDGAIWSSPFLGFSVQRPEDWEFADLSPSLISGDILALKPKTSSSTRIAVSLRDLPYNKTVQELLEDFIGRGKITSLTHSLVDQRPVIRIDYDKKKLLLFNSSWTTAAIVDGESVILFTMQLGDGNEHSKIFDRVLSSIRFARPKE